MTSNRRQKSHWHFYIFFVLSIFIVIFLVKYKILEKIKSWPKQENSAQNNGPISGKVLHIKDGDSFIMRLDTDNQSNIEKFPNQKEVEVRLSSIDAPEYNQNYGQECRQELSDLIRNKSISIEPETQDRYGRTIAIVFIANNNVNREMVRRGCAWAYRKYLSDYEMLKLEREAKANNLRIWSQDPAQIIPPWEIRNK